MTIRHFQVIAFICIRSDWWPEVDSGLVKLVVMTNVFFNNQQHKIKIKRFLGIKQITSSFFTDSWNQRFYS